MCYVFPGPRCSAHTWGEYMSARADCAALSAEAAEAHADLQAWAVKNPGMLAHPPVDLLNRFEFAKTELEIADKKMSAARRDWEITPHGIHVAAVDASMASGLMSPRQIAEYRKSRARVESIYAEHYAMHKQGVEPSAQFTTELKQAEKDFREVSKESAGLLFAKASFFMRQNADKYGVDAKKPFTVDPMNVKHAEGLADFCRSQMAGGQMRDPNGAAKGMINCQIRATGRARAIARMNEVKGGLTKYLSEDDYDAPVPKDEDINPDGRKTLHRDYLLPSQRPSAALNEQINEERDREERARYREDKAKSSRSAALVPDASALASVAASVGSDW